MSHALQLIHLTDLHLLGYADARLHDWHVEQAFVRVLDHAREHGPAADAWVLGGDLVDDESRTGYARLNAHLAALGRPVLAMTGNHDDPSLMAETLTHAQVHGCRRLGDWQLIALNSHVAGSDAGRLGAPQLRWLDRQLARCDAPAVLFVHHPPCRVGSAWIDAIGLADHDALRAVVARHAHVRALVCGHAHQACTLTFVDRPCFVTPSTMRQFAPGAGAFATDTQSAPGYRWLRLGANGSFETGIVRVEIARTACGQNWG